MVLNICHSKNDLELEIVIKSDTVNHLQAIVYQVKWYNKSNDTIKIRDDWRTIIRPKIEVRKVDDKRWSELWRSSENLIRQCELRPGGPLWCGYTRPYFFIIPPKEAIIFEASYFPITENIDQSVLVPDNIYEFRFIIPAVLEQMKISQKTDFVYIDYSTIANEAFLAKMIDFGLNPYDLFKSWNSCSKDSSVVRKFEELRRSYPNNDIAELIQLKITEWDRRTMSDEDFARRYSKENLLGQLEALKNMLKGTFYDKMLIREMIYENLEKGLSNGYDFEEYFDNLIFAEER
jgi:hypothetical protein